MSARPRSLRSRRNRLHRHRRLLKSSLTTPQDEIGRLSVKLKSKPRDHDCKQARITVLAPAERLPEDGS